MTRTPSSLQSSGDVLDWRTLTDSDLAEAAHLSASFGWPHGTEDWAVMLALGTGVVGRECSGSLIATGMRWSYARTGTLGVIIVAKDWQSRGIGHGVMQRLLEGASMPLLLHATEAGQSLYTRYGFCFAGRARQLQGHCAGPIASARVRFAEPKEHESIIALDAAAFGDRRHALMTALLRSGSALVSIDAGVVDGFAIRRTFGRGALIGPVAAPNVETALELTCASLVPGFNRVDLAVDDPQAIAVLARHGLADAGAVVPMIRGDWPWAPGSVRQKSFALASQAFG